MTRVPLPKEVLPALGRAFRGAGAALGRFETWFLVLALGVCLPWVVVLLRIQVATLPPAGGPGIVDAVVFGVPWKAVDAVLTVWMLARFVPILDGRRGVAIGGGRLPLMRLLGAAAALAGADLAWHLFIILGWFEPIAIAFGSGGIHAVTGILSLVSAWVCASVIFAMRSERAWDWRARHLLVGGVLLFVGHVANSKLIASLQQLERRGQVWLEGATGPEWLPPPWWVVMRVLAALVLLVVLEYLSAVPTETAEEAAA